jgi:hypothetical protein
VTGIIDWIILIVLAAGAASYLRQYFKSPSVGSLTALKDFVYSLVLQAEARWGAKTGEAKRAYVVQGFYERAPEVLRGLVSADKLLTVIEAAVTRMKEYFLRNPPARDNIVGGG